MDSHDLNEKVFIVTGATSGMGKAIAQQLGKKGAQLILSGRNTERGEEVAEGINEDQGAALFVPGDVGKVAYNQSLVQEAVRSFGGIDGVATNAGMLGLGSITDVSISQWRNTYSTNLDAVFYLLKYAIPIMQEGGGGAVVVNASIAATKSFPNHPAYCSSKAALVALARQAAVEYGPLIRVNTISPGPVDTPLIWDSAKAFPDPARAVQDAGEATLMQRLGTPADVAKLVLFLLSENASWITGANFTIDGGITAKG
ncbi:MAG: glucose 1-dehydrogenase [Saprospiraceae bacterium]|nr:glucose 1-dehydrogenase [Saprospiraceae bacterium]